jgi:hypothetical protein
MSQRIATPELSANEQSIEIPMESRTNDLNLYNHGNWDCIRKI